MTQSPESLLQVPEEIAVMVLPGVQLFPGSLVPLYIFEERYRAMLEDALLSYRLFAVGARREDEKEIGGLGIVRACVRNDDGTSHLILQGLQRVRFRRWHDRQLYPSAFIEVVSSITQPEDAVRRERVVSLCWKLREHGVVFPEAFARQLQALQDPALLSDVLAAALVQDESLRRQLLEELKVSRRLTLLEKYLRAWTNEAPPPA